MRVTQLTDELVLLKYHEVYLMVCFTPLHMQLINKKQYTDAVNIKRFFSVLLKGK